MLGRRLLLWGMVASMLGACTSARVKERQGQRDRASASSGLYCDFISGDEFPDIEVELNLKMSQRCDNEKPFSLTQYKGLSENIGVIYCCGTNKKDKEKNSEPRGKRPEPGVIPPPGPPPGSVAPQGPPPPPAE